MSETETAGQKRTIGMTDSEMPPGKKQAIDARKVKTKPCRFFSQEGCRFGATCSFLHEGEMPSPARNTTATSTFSKSGSRPKSIPCKFFFKPEGCSVGESCPYLHEHFSRSSIPTPPFGISGFPMGHRFPPFSPMNAANAVQQQLFPRPGPSQLPPALFGMGHQMHGALQSQFAIPVSPSSHGSKNFRTKVCTFFSKGTCSKGDNCEWIHENVSSAPQTQAVSKGSSSFPSSALSASTAVSSEKKTESSLPKNKTVCKFFAQGQGCRYGNKCQFLHPSSALESNSHSQVGRFMMGGISPAGHQSQYHTYATQTQSGPYYLGYDGGSGSGSGRSGGAYPPYDMGVSNDLGDPYLQGQSMLSHSYAVPDPRHNGYL